MSEKVIENGFTNSDRRAVGDAAYLVIATLIVKILGLIYKIPLANVLGEEGMGYFNSAYTVYAVFYLLCTAGVPKAITMLSVDSSCIKGKYDSSDIVRIALRLFFLIGFVLSLCFALLAVPLSRIIGNSNCSLTMLSIAPSILFISMTGVFRGYLNAKLALIHVGISQILEGVLRLALGLIFAYVAINKGLSAEYISAFTIFGVTLGSIISFLYIFIYSKFKFEYYKTGQRINRRDYLNLAKGIFSISLPITLSSAVMSIGSIIDLGLIMRRLESIGYTELQASALYGNYTTFSVPMFNFVISMITPLSIAYLPTFIKNRKGSDLNKVLKESLSITAFICAPMTVGLICYSEEILTIIFGEISSVIGSSLLCLLMPSTLFASILLITNSVLESQGSVRAPLYAMICGGLIKIITSYLLLGNPNYAISGAPISTVISYAVSLVVSVLYLSKKHHIITPIISTQLLPYMNSILSVFISKLIYNKLIINHDLLLSLSISIVICAFIYLIISLFSGTINTKKILKIAKYTKITE